MAGRSRLFVQGEATLGSQETVDVQFPLPFNATFLQILIKLSSIPTTAGVVTLKKVSVSGPLLDVIIRTYDPVAGLFTDFICTDYYEFRKGDTMVITYANPDDLGVGIECVLKEGD